MWAERHSFCQKTDPSRMIKTCSFGHQFKSHLFNSHVVDCLLTSWHSSILFAPKLTFQELKKLSLLDGNKKSHLDQKLLGGLCFD
jgi:hypothetical protein